MKKSIALLLSLVMLLLASCGTAPTTVPSTEEAMLSTNTTSTEAVTDGTTAPTTDATTATTTVPTTEQATTETTEPASSSTSATESTTQATEGTTKPTETTEKATESTTAPSEAVVLAFHVPSLSLSFGDTVALGYNYTGTKTLTWSSSDASVASVDNMGNVTVKSKEGTTTIKVTDGSKSDTCTITVKDYTLKLNKTELTITVGDTYTMGYTYTGNKSLSWSSSDNAVFTVSSKGVITAKSAGSAALTLTDGFKTSQCWVTVKAKENTDVGTLTIHTKKDTTVYIGETLQIDFTYTGDKSKLTFKSQDTSILTVNNSGLVTGVSNDWCKVYVYHGNIELGSVRLYVTARPDSGPKAESISAGEFTGPYFNGISGVVGNYMTFSALAKTSGDNQKVTATSSNTSVATVSFSYSSGSYCYFKVSFVGAGTTTITITSEDGCASTSYTLNVKSNYACNPGGGLLSPEDFAYYANQVMSDNGATIDTNSYMGYRVLTLSPSELTWSRARSYAEGWIREFWPNGIRYMGLAYQGVNEDGKYVFYIHR